MASQRILGIDLGTTNSCIAVIQDGKPVVIPNSEGYRTTPSIVSFGKNGERFIGQTAKRQAITNPERTIQSIKRRMGTNYRCSVAEQIYSPEQISALILSKLRSQAEAYLGEKVNRAIITVPAYFDDAQRLATRDAGQIAGLDVVRIINEPTACALTYGFNRLNQEANLVIFDFGGGTFDVTILQLAEQVLHVKATNGINQLGGDDFDNRIITWLNEQFRRSHGIDLSNDVLATQRFRDAAEKAKIELSQTSSAQINLPFLAYSDGTALSMETALSADEFNRLTVDLVQAVDKPIQNALADAKIPADQIDHVILVGGTTRVPAVQQFIRTFFHKEPVKSVNPDEAVAVGAAIQGGILTGEIEEVLLLDVVPMTISLEVGGDRVNKIFERNSTIPADTKRTFTTAVDNQASVHVHIVQGENEKASENKSVGRFNLQMPPGPARSTKIEVSFNIDADGIFYCTAPDREGAAHQRVILKRTHGLDRADLNRMADEAAAQAEKERLEEERTAANVMAESCLSDAERTLKKYGDQASLETVVQVKSMMGSLKKAMEEATTEEIESLTEKLEASLVKCMKAPG